MMLESFKLMQFCQGETSVIKRGVSRVSQYFQWAFGLNQVNYARITITHVCFIALILVGDL